MLQEIKTMQDVKTFIEQIASEIDYFSPDKDFADYLCPDSITLRYTKEEAEIRNQLLMQCLKVCEINIEDYLEYIVWYYELTTAKMTGTV